MADPARHATNKSAPKRGTGIGGRVGADLPARVGAAVVLMALALGSAWAGGYWFTAFWLIAAILVDWEWQNLIGGPNRDLRGAFGAVGLFIAAPLATNDAIFWAIVALLAGAIGASLTSGSKPRFRLMPAAGVLYAGAMLVSVCLLRASQTDGLAAILWLFAVVWGADVMAYFGGRLIGGPKLWPSISPGKTWAGFVVGVVCGALAGLLTSGAASSSVLLFVFGLVTAAVSQGGDLFESFLKRRFGVKDSSHLIPGHGGLMDRLDGFIAAAVFAALVGAARHGIVNIAAGIFAW
jgi:phosphatidate cytidylyltransferase